jgi:hypothetical protein
LVLLLIVFVLFWVELAVQLAPQQHPNAANVSSGFGEGRTRQTIF